MPVPSLDQEDPWRRAWQPTPVFLPGESHGQRSLAGSSPSGIEESDTTEATQQAQSVVATLNIMDVLVNCIHGNA